MYRHPPQSTRTYTPFPYTTLVRSHELWYDDVRVDLDTIDYIPEGRYALLPYASDDSVAWTPSTAGDNYPMIDEWTCDQDSTYNTSNVVGEDRKSTRLNSSHYCASRMPSYA